jgi:hypothetical protein
MGFRDWPDGDGFGGSLFPQPAKPGSRTLKSHSEALEMICEQCLGRSRVAPPEPGKVLELLDPPMYFDLRLRSRRKRGL